MSDRQDGVAANRCDWINERMGVRCVEPAGHDGPHTYGTPKAAFGDEEATVLGRDVSLTTRPSSPKVASAAKPRVCKGSTRHARDCGCEKCRPAQRRV